MNLVAENTELLDRKTSRSICDAVGEQLQHKLRPDWERLPANLRGLLDELDRQETHASKSLRPSWVKA